MFGRGGDPQSAFPTLGDLRAQARRRVPRFAFEYIDGGAGDDGGIDRNQAALAGVQIVPRYGSGVTDASIQCELFGRTYRAPIGVAPMGAAGITWPGSEAFLAIAAQRAGIPYALSTVAGLSIERAAELAPDVFWFQLHRIWDQDLAASDDLVRRADRSGAHVLILTLDAGARVVRPRTARGGMKVPFRPSAATLLDMARCPGWLAALAQYGVPRFASVSGYAGRGAPFMEVMRYMQRTLGGTFSWEEVARFRDAWPRPLVVKGVMHPADAARAVSIGVDGIIVSNHGGRQSELLPAPIDVLPSIARRIAGRATLMMDSGVRSGQDVVRALALGASAAFLGKGFLWAVGALGEAGGDHAADILRKEIAGNLAQIGCADIGALTRAEVHHPTAYAFADDADSTP